MTLNDPSTTHTMTQLARENTHVAMVYVKQAYDTREASL